MKLSEIIRKYRKRSGYSMEAFAKRCGVSKAYIGFIENNINPTTGKPIVPNIQTLSKLASGMGMTLDELVHLMDADDEISLKDDSIKVSLPHPEPVREIPIYGNICCGNGLFVDDEIVSSISVPIAMLPNKSAEYFAQYAQGDSMTGAGIHDGDLIVFEKTPAIDPGQIGCFCIDENEAVCKKYTVSNHFIVLLPANDKYDPITVDPVSECFKVIGRKVLTISK